MPVNSGAVRILILAGDADGNLGDRAILLATGDMLRALVNQPLLTAVSTDPHGATTDSGITVIAPGPRGFFPLLRAIRASDLVLCGGGGLFQDDDSLVKMPYWALKLVLARIMGARVAGWSLGIGPLDAGVSQWFARLAFACMEPISARDPLAVATAQRLTQRPVALVADPAAALEPAPDRCARTILERHGVPLDGRVLLGLAPRRWFPPRRRIVPHRLAARLRPQRPEPAEQGHLVHQLAAVVTRFASRHNAHVVFLPSYTLSHEADDRMCEAIRAAMPDVPSSLIHLDDPRLYKAVSARLTMLLGGRMHPAILAASAGTRIVGLGYNPKFHGFFELMGLSDHLLDVGEFVRGRQTDRLLDMLERTLGDPPPDPARSRRHTDASRAWLRTVTSWPR